jgi:F0F1-type ATP synthase membrane subunit c/vacuolar-type H+-ATPase subunit K
MLFIKAAKVVALGIAALPLAGCAVGTGLVFASLLKSLSYAPDSEESLFSYAALGFAFVESFALMTFVVVGLIYVF